MMCWSSLLIALHGIPALTAETSPAFALPMEIETDSGAANGDATLLRIMPVYATPTRENWRLIHLDLIVLADAPGGVPGRPGNPEPIPGGRATGLSDLVPVRLYTPNQTGNLIWGIGAMLSIPTATHDSLGSGKWALGPAFRIVYRNGPWNVGAIGGQRWSFAGGSHRAGLNQFMIRAAIRRRLGAKWYFVSAPIITANLTSSGSWLVPLGGGIGRTFRLGGNEWAASIQGYANVIKPSGAPDWSVRASLTAMIPTRRR